MAVESATHISDLNPATIGDATDPAEGGAQISMVKQVLKTDFANVNAAVTASAAELNYVDIATLGTAENSKALTMSASGTWTLAGKTCTDGGSFTTIDINGGTIDGVTINGAVGGGTPAAGAFTTLTASSTVTFTSGTINGISVGATTPDSGAFTTLTASGAVTFTSGTLNGVSVGASTPSSGAFTTLTASGAVTFTSGTINGASVGASNPSSGAFTTLSSTGAATVGGTLGVTGAATFTTAKATSEIGYATGAGGTVTQVTSRTTGVSINKPCGSITLVSAAGSATYATFTVTNSTVAATDTVHVCQKSGTDRYRIHVTAVAAGSFNVTFATVTGTTTEQPVFNFAVIKGVTS